MTNVEIERLIVKLVADTTRFNSEMEKAARKAEETAERVAKSQEKVTFGGMSITKSEMIDMMTKNPGWADMFGSALSNKEKETYRERVEASKKALKEEDIAYQVYLQRRKQGINELADAQKEASRTAAADEAKRLRENSIEHQVYMKRRQEGLSEVQQAISDKENKEKEAAAQRAREEDIQHQVYMSRRKEGMAELAAAQKKAAQEAQKASLDAMKAEQAKLKESDIEHQMHMQRRKEGMAELEVARRTTARNERSEEAAREKAAMNAQRITERYGPKDERLALKMSPIQQAYQSGAISAATYERAVRKVGEEVENAGRKQSKFGISFEIWKASMAIMLVGTGAAMVRWLVKMSGEQERLNTALQEGARLTDRIGVRNDARLTKEVEMIDMVVDETAKEAALKEKLAQIEKELGVGESGGVQDRRRKALKDLETFQGGKPSAIAGRLVDNMFLSGTGAEVLKNALAEANKEYDLLLKQSDALRKKIDDMSPEKKLAKAKSEAEKYAAELEKLESKTANLSDKDSQVLAIEEKIADFRKRGADVTLLEAQKQQIEKNILSDKADKFIKSLEREAMAIKHQGNQAKAIALEYAGLNEEKRKEVETAVKATEELRKLNEVQKEAARLAKDARTPRQKFTELRADLEKAQAAFPEVIDDAVFRQALKKGREEMERMDAHSEHMAQNMERVEAALAGSAEEASRIEKQRDLFAGSTKDVRDAMNAPNAVPFGNHPWANEALRLWRRMADAMEKKPAVEIKPG